MLGSNINPTTRGYDLSEVYRHTKHHPKNRKGTSARTHGYPAILAARFFGIGTVMTWSKLFSGPLSISRPVYQQDTYDTSTDRHCSPRAQSSHARGQRLRTKSWELTHSCYCSVFSTRVPLSSSTVPCRPRFPVFVGAVSSVWVPERFFFLEREVPERLRG